MDYLRALIGIIGLIGIAYVLSGHKKAIDWKLVGSGILMQIIIALLITQVPFLKSGFEVISAGFVKFLNFGLIGAEFLYGDLAKNSDSSPDAWHNLGFLFIFQALPTVIFFSSVTAGLYYLGVLQKLVFGFAWVMSRTMRLSGAESLSVAGNIILGQTEAPLLVRPFIKGMTQSELMCLMTGGMATIVSSVLGAYVAFLGGGDPHQQAQFATYLLTASIMNAPAAIVMSKIFLPELKPEQVDSSLQVNNETMGDNVIDALARGAADGVGGMLLAFIAIIYTLNWVLVDGIGSWTGLNAYVLSSTNGAFEGFSLQYLLGQLFRPLAFLIGIDWDETILVGSLLGQKTVINEFVAYLSLAQMKATGVLSAKAIVISTFAICGFANFSSIAILLGGIGGMAPTRQADLSKLGLKALMAATMATLTTAAIAGAVMEYYHPFII